MRRFATQILVPAAIGVGTGAVVAALSLLVEERALRALSELPSALPALPSLFCLLLTLLVVRYVTRASHPTTSEVFIVAYHDAKTPIVLRQIPGRILGAATTVAGGGSQGLESPSALIGAGLGRILGARLGPTAEEARSWMVAGASAGIAAVFSSPGVGTLYGLEVPFRRDVDARRFIPAAIAAASAYATRVALVGARHLVAFEGAANLDATFALGCVLVAIGSGAGARAFSLGTECLRSIAHRSKPWVRAAVAGAVLAALAWSGHALTGRWITFGPGYVAAGWLASGEHAVWLLVAAMLVRTVGTLTCVFGGGGGGVFTSLAIGGVFVGEIVAQVLGRTETGFFPLLGGACFLAGGYRIPLAGVLLVAETTGDPMLTVVALLAVGLVQIMMGDASVSDAKHESRGLSEAPAGSGSDTPRRERTTGRRSRVRSRART